MKERVCKEGASISEIFRVLKDAVIAVAAEVVGHTPQRVQRKGNAWWTNEIMEAIEGKGRRENKKIMGRNVAEKSKKEN